jgi:hypothetical protein
MARWPCRGRAQEQRHQTHELPEPIADNTCSDCNSPTRMPALPVMRRMTAFRLNCRLAVRTPPPPGVAGRLRRWLWTESL